MKIEGNIGLGASWNEENAVLTRSQYYKRNYVLKKSILVLNTLMVCYLIFDHKNTLNSLI